jgi:hypothetical protein
MTEEPTTEELREEQARRERVELEQAESTDDEVLAAQHQRRAEKARYLRRKLDERACAEQESQP